MVSERGGSMFFGQIETLLLIGPCLLRLTTSELTLAISAGFASISGSVLFAYISMGVSGRDRTVQGHFGKIC